MFKKKVPNFVFEWKTISVYSYCLVGVMCCDLLLCFFEGKRFPVHSLFSMVL